MPEVHVIVAGIMSVCADKIAIIGIGCRLPGGVRSLDDLVALLSEGRDVVSAVGADRFSTELYYHPDPAIPGKSYTFAAGLIEDLRDFDSSFFGLSPRQALQTDPQQRLLLQTTWEAFDQAGINPWTLADRNVGVYVGTAALDYGNRFHQDPSAADAHFMPGNTLSIIANRLSFVYDLTGESLVTDTACSSAMTALHKACESLAAGRTSMAIAAGVHALLLPHPFIGFSRAMMLSPDGRCKAFDASANGFVRAEGAVSLVLAPLEKAQKEGWPVLGVIRATGLNTDGHKNALWEPAPALQEALMRDVMRAAGLTGDDYAYLEAHGTGTAVGDPREAQAIGHAVARERQKGRLPIGSIKSNIGHLEPASGMASIAKALASFRARELFASLHIETPNPAIDFTGLNIHLQTVSAPLPDGVIGINCFGFGGTNAHVIIEPPPVLPAPAVSALSPEILDDAFPPIILTARHKDSLRDMAQDYLALLQTGTDIHELAAAAAYHRPRLEYTAIIQADSGEETIELLQNYAAGRLGTEALIEERQASDTDKKSGAVFVYTGNGSQWIGMARQLFERSTLFRRHMETIDAVLEPLLCWSVIDALRAGHHETAPAMDRAEIGQPLLFAIQVALTYLMRDCGIVPHAVLGHSVGEIAAAHAAGKLTLAQSSAIVVARALAQSATFQSGGIAALGCSAQDFNDLVKPSWLSLELAAINAPNAVTVSGTDDVLEKLESYARAHDIFYKKIDAPYPYHSSRMDETVRAAFADRYDRTVKENGKSSIPDQNHPVFVSTVTGGVEHGSLDRDYWWRNIRQPVLFEQAVRTAAHLHGDDSAVGAYIEIGPHAILLSYIRKILADSGRKAAVTGTQFKNQDQGHTLQALLARCYALGITNKPKGLVRYAAKRLMLPTYPWRNETIAWPSGQEAYYKQESHPFLGRRSHTADSAQQTWTTQIDPCLFPYLEDHKLDKKATFPASGFIEILFAAAATRMENGKKPVLYFKNAFITAPLVFANGQSPSVTIECDRTGAVQIKSALSGKDDPAQIHVRAHITTMARQPYYPARMESRIASSLEAAALYKATERNGLSYDGLFRSLTDISLHEDGSCSARVTQIDNGPYIIHPALLDNALQLMFTQVNTGHEDLRKDGWYLPFGFEKGWVDTKGGKVDRLTLKARTLHPLSLSADIVLSDVHDNQVAVFENVRFRFMPHEHETTEKPQSFVEKWIPVLSAAPVSTGTIHAATALQPSDEVPLLLNALALSIYTDVWRSLPHRIEKPLYHEIYRTLLHEGLIDENGNWIAQATIPDTGTIYDLLQENPETLPWTGLMAGAADKIRHALQPTHLEGKDGNRDLCRSFFRRICQSGPASSEALVAIQDLILGLQKKDRRFQGLRIAEITDGYTDVFSEIAQLAGAALTSYTLYSADDTQDALNSPYRQTDVEIIFQPLTAWSDGHRNRYDLIIDSRLMAGRTSVKDADIVIRNGLQPEYRLAGWLATDLLPEIVQEHAGDSWGFSVRSTPYAHQETVSVLKNMRFIHMAHDTDLGCLAAEILQANGGTVELRDEAPDNFPDNAFIIYTPRLDSHSAEECFMAFRQIAMAAQSPVIMIYDMKDDVFASALAGLRRAMANEWPDKKLYMVGCDFQGHDDFSSLGNHLSNWLATLILSPEDYEWRVAATGMSCLRYDLHDTQCDTDRSLIVLGQDRPGHLDALRWENQAMPSTGAHDVVIDMKAASLNFRDVMWAMGMLEPEALLSGYAGATLGMEGAGIVRSTGSAVTRLKPGDRVMAYGGQALANRMIVSEASVCLLPDGLDFEEAATIPAAFLTAWYALHEIGRLRQGEHILIHGAAGGVGLAAIQIARLKGAHIHVTAGSLEKRAYLSHMGLTNIYDSRTSSFADQILQATKGEGIDIVLNSLSGEALHRNFDILKPFGRYLELGKRDFYADTPIGLRPFRNNISYHGIDMDQLMAERPAYGQQLFAEMMGMFSAGNLRPLPYQIFDSGHIHLAFRTFWRAHHIGKIVVDLSGLENENSDKPVAPLQNVNRILPDRPYIITGGHSGIGLSSACWLADQGANHVVLVSRSGRPKSNEDKAIIAALRARSVRVDDLACDVTSEEALKNLLQTYVTAGGIIHAAAVLDDRLLMQTDMASVSRVYGPKLQAAIMMDRLTHGMDLSLFIMFSSVTTMIGNVGQASYVAANAGLEALARARRAGGRHALCVSLGPVADTGLLTRSEQAAARDIITHKFGENGFITTEDIFSTLDSMLEHDETHRILSRMNWPALGGSLPLLRTKAYRHFHTLMQRAQSGENPAARMKLDGMGATERTALFLDMVRAETAKVMMTDAARLPVDKAFTDMGIDSLLSIELHMAIEEETGMDIPASYLSPSMNMADFAALLARLSMDNTDNDQNAGDDDSALLEKIGRRHASLTDSHAAIEILKQEISGTADRK